MTKATIFDVARVAGVSKSTVSLVLNHSPNVTEKTKQKVLEAIKSTNYVPNFNARSMRIGYKSIGIIHTIRNGNGANDGYDWNNGLGLFSRDVENGVFAGVLEKESEIGIVLEHYDLSKKNAEMPKLISENRVSGVIFVGGFADADVTDIMQDSSIPIVLVTSSRHTKEDTVDTVFHDPTTGSYLATKKFIETGHKRICLVNCPESYQVWPMRIDGVRLAAKECDFEIDDNMLISMKTSDAKSAYSVFSEMLDKGLVPDAVLAANNEAALGVMRCLYERKLRIPDDISLIAYEDSTLCGNMSPALSSINIHKELLGKIAVSFLLDRINNPVVPIKTVTIKPRLVMRDSVMDRNTGSICRI